MSNHVTLPCAQLCDYHSGEPIRIASYEEARRELVITGPDGTTYLW